MQRCRPVAGSRRPESREKPFQPSRELARREHFFFRFAPITYRPRLGPATPIPASDLCRIDAPANSSSLTLAAPSPRVRGEGWGEGAPPLPEPQIQNAEPLRNSLQAQNRGEAPS